MVTRLAAVVTSFLVVLSSVASVSAAEKTTPSAPLRQAIARHASRLAVNAGRKSVSASAQTASQEDDRSWPARHPVWTGAMAGFAIGFVLPYTSVGKNQSAFLDPVDPGGPALVFGGIGAGLGALAGWGWSRDK